jgi:hypothetical protein
LAWENLVLSSVQVGCNWRLADRDRPAAIGEARLMGRSITDCPVGLKTSRAGLYRH